MAGGMAQNEPNRSRRRVLKTIPTALCTVGIGSAVAEDDASPSSDEPIRGPGGGGGKPIHHLFSDQAESVYGTEKVHNGLDVMVREAETYGGQPFSQLPIQCSGNGLTEDSDGTPLENIRYSGQYVDWEAGSAEGNDPLVDAYNNEFYIGKFDSTMSDPGGVDPVLAVISAGISMLPGGGTFAASVIANIMLNGVDTVGKDSTKIERSWDWGGQAWQASWWGKYDIFLMPGEFFTFQVGDYVQSEGNTTAMNYGEIQVYMPNNPDPDTIRSELQRGQLEAAGARGVDLSHHTEGLRVYSGRVAKRNPELFHSIDLDDVDDDQIVYKFPVRSKVVSRSPSPEKFDLMH